MSAADVYNFLKKDYSLRKKSLNWVWPSENIISNSSIFKALGIQTKGKYALIDMRIK